MTIAGVIILIIIILTLISGVALGIYKFIKYQDSGCAFAAILFGTILLLLSSVVIAYVVDDNTEKVLGKGTITTEVDFDYFNGGKDKSNEIKYFIEVESGDKIIIDKSEWDNIKDEYTYIPSKVNVIRGDDE